MILSSFCIRKTNFSGLDGRAVFARVSALFFVLCFLAGCAALAPKAKVEKNKTAPVSAKKTANSIKSIRVEKEGETLSLFFKSLGRVNYTAFKLNSPLRLVFDFSDMGADKIEPPAGLPSTPVKRVKTQYFPATKSMRVELFLDEAVEHEIFRTSDVELKVMLKPRARKPKTALAKVVPERRQSVSSNAPEVDVFDVDFMAVPEKKSRVIIKVRGGKPSFKIVKDRKKKTLVMDVENATISGRGAKELDTSRVSPLVKRVSSFQVKGEGAGKLVRVRLDLFKNVSYNIFRDGESLYVDLEGMIEKEVQPLRGSMASSGAKQRVDGSTAGGLPAVVKAPASQRVSMDFYEADIVNVLKLIADVSQMNIITGDGVQGKITMRLVNVPWEQALNVVLKTAKLGMVQEENIIRVAPLSNILAEKKAETDAKMAEIETSVAEEDMEELALEILPVNYAKASDMVQHLDKVKGARGNISIDTRTNSLILRDTRNRLSSMKTLVQRLDIRTPQVLIEARIVEVNRDFTHTLGIQWGGKTGVTTGLGFPAAVGTSASVLGGSIGPIAATGGPGGAISATLGSVTGTTSLDIKLNALEERSKARILSTPRVVASDNTEAKISSGSSIPYETVSSSGTQTQWKEAALTLTVTPHVTLDGYVSLDIRATKNEVLSDGSISIKEANTKVLIRDGDTTVIGGIYKTTVDDKDTEIPWFSKIPFLGWLFKTKTKSDKGEELLIFITPRILHT